MTAPAHALSAVAVDAYKKMLLVWFLLPSSTTNASSSGEADSTLAPEATNTTGMCMYALLV